jgi:hypothetical protein
MRRLWTKMAEVYGADVWERRYGTAPSGTWESVLGGLALADLARGIGRCERDDSGRLPTLGQFHALCRHYQSGSFAGNAPPEGGVAALLERAESAGVTETSQRYVDMCRRLTKGGRLTDEERASLPELR